MSNLLTRVLAVLLVPLGLWSTAEWVYNPDELEGLTGSNCTTFELPASPGPNVTYHPDAVCRETPSHDGFIRQTGLRMHAPSRSACASGTGDVEILRACVLGHDGKPAAGQPTPCSDANGNTTGPKGCKPCDPPPDTALTCHSPTLAQEIIYLQELKTAAAGTPLAHDFQTAIDRAEDAADDLAASHRQSAAGNMASAIAQIEGAVWKRFIYPGRGATLMDDFAGFARQLAVTAIDEAQARGGDPATINGARGKVAEGDGLLLTGGILRTQTPENEDLAHPVRRRGWSARADLVADGNAVLAIGCADFHLDEFVRRERPIHFGHQPVSHARTAGLHHRFECVRTRLQMSAFSGGQVNIVLWVLQVAAEPKRRVLGTPELQPLAGMVHNSCTPLIFPTMCRHARSAALESP